MNQEFLRKYPRTFHLPWSPGISRDDKVLESIENFIGKEVIVTWKMDGENTTLYKDYYHARSLDSKHHISQDWLKKFHSQFKFDIPEGWRICGENLFATHRIHYNSLKSYFYGFSIWNSENVCLNWDETIEWFELFGINPVEVIYSGIFDEKLLKKIDLGENEGYVVRLKDSFKYEDFSKSVAKYVRSGFVPGGTQHWRSCQIVPNGLETGFQN